MEELRILLRQVLNDDLIQIILSNTRDETQGSKIKIRPVLIRQQLLFQETLYRGTQVFHENFSGEQLQSRIENYLQQLFKQGEIKSSRGEAVILVSKKGKMTIKKKGNFASGKDKLQGNSTPEKDYGEKGNLEHNRTKQYILQDGKPVDFLVGLGVQTPDGKVTKTRYDKFRQINRYLEFIEDVMEELPKDRTFGLLTLDVENHI